MRRLLMVRISADLQFSEDNRRAFIPKAEGFK